MELQPHQQRVVDEKTELDDKRTKLKAFIEGNAIFAGLPEEKKDDWFRRLVKPGQTISKTLMRFRLANETSSATGGAQPASTI